MVRDPVLSRDVRTISLGLKYSKKQPLLSCFADIYSIPDVADRVLDQSPGMCRCGRGKVGKSLLTWVMTI